MCLSSAPADGRDGRKKISPLARYDRQCEARGRTERVADKECCRVRVLAKDEAPIAARVVLPRLDRLFLAIKPLGAGRRSENARKDVGFRDGAVEVRRGKEGANKADNSLVRQPVKYCQRRRGGEYQRQQIRSGHGQHARPSVARTTKRSSPSAVSAPAIGNAVTSGRAVT